MQIVILQFCTVSFILWRSNKNESNHIYIKYRKYSRVCKITGKGIESSLVCETNDVPENTIEREDG